MSSAHNWGTGKITIEIVLNEVNKNKLWISKISRNLGISRQRVSKYIHDNFNTVIIRGAGRQGRIITVTPK